MFALSLAGPQPVPTVGHQNVMAHGSPLPQKHSSSPGEDYKFFTRVRITFPIIYSSDTYTHTSQDNRLPEAGPPCSVQLGSRCRPVCGRGDKPIHVLTLPFLCGY